MLNCVIYLNPTPINPHYRSSPHLLNPTHPYSTHQWLLQPHWWIHYHQLLTNPPSTHTQTYLHHKDTISDYQYGTILPPKDQQRVANTAHIAEAPPVVPSITAPITAPIPSSNAVVKPSTKTRLSVLESTVSSLKLNLENFILETRIKLGVAAVGREEEEDEEDEEGDEEAVKGNTDDEDEGDDEDQSSALNEIINDVNEFIDNNGPSCYAQYSFYTT